MLGNSGYYVINGQVLGTWIDPDCSRALAFAGFASAPMADEELSKQRQVDERTTGCSCRRLSRRRC